VVSGGAAANGVNSAGPPGTSSADNTHLHISQHGVPMSSSSHHSHPTHANQDRINHSSPNKALGSSSIGIASANANNNNGINMVGSQAGSIQQGSVGGISMGIGGISGMSSSGARPSMNQTGHGKSFPYSMHRKTNSNKLPHIGSSNSKDNTS